VKEKEKKEEEEKENSVHHNYLFILLFQTLATHYIYTSIF
jgi:hypothetical protein